MGLAALAGGDELPPHRAEGPRVYVVDDDSAVRAAISLLLRSAGWDAVPCADVDDFLARYRPGGSCCVIVDLRMPGRSGVELQRELRRRGERVPVIVVTAHHDQPDAALSRALGARAVLGKPFRDGDLIRLVHEALEVA